MADMETEPAPMPPAPPCDAPPELPVAKRIKLEDAPAPAAASVAAAPVTAAVEKPSAKPLKKWADEHDPSITFEIFTNDGSEESSVALIALKNIFSLQLPKMPKEYIVRLVLDRRHISLAIQLNGKIIGGICYRPYYEQRFGEIAFCAISAYEQVKGHGTKLMSNLKYHVQKDKLEYFLTYADNYAIGYFTKQGFTKHVSMPKERWVGYIKDYDGGTLMECYIHPNFDYLHQNEIIAKQRAFIYQRILARSQSGKIYSGQTFRDGRRFFSALEIPGVSAAGWSNVHIFRGNTERDRNHLIGRMHGEVKRCLDQISINAFASGFYDTLHRCPEFRTAVEDPIDLSVIYSRLTSRDYYRSNEMVKRDLQLLTKSHKQFFGSDSREAAAADAIDKIVAEFFKDNSAAPNASGAEKPSQSDDAH